MPSGTKRVSRTVRTSPIAPQVIPNLNEPCSHRYSPAGSNLPTLQAVEQPAAPKHFPFPSTPVDDDFFFEFLMCFFTVTSAGLQYMHLYRSVWWLPHSYTNQALNFYLIDKYLVMFIVLVLSRRLIYMISCKVLERFVLNSQETVQFYLRSFLFGALCVLLFVCAYYVMQNHPVVNILYLCYPVFIYLILFGFNICPFFELVNWTRGAPPLHACSCSAVDIRREVENLKSNFNCRMKQILFSAILNAYYAGFIPCCFAQPALHYDTFWATQHVIFIFISGFVSLTIHILSLRYCDILHRSALHLGSWEKENGRNMMMSNTTWRDDIFWPGGTLVRHGRDIYKAQGDCNSSEPGNLGLRRFYYIFKNPTDPLSSILLLHVFMILYQLVLLVRSVLWHNIVSLTFILFFNYYVLYKLFRDYLVSSKLYMEEREMQKKIYMQ
ncbi:hypothetical protein NQ315_003087 [Exocentrus adspersus]|uniref:Transmembrane protein 39A n=1 Tax=Exocentrus adspersus TaxID=1586481 RepID=A0AAV8W4X4_9CUCU|nr:hypothetical protein NQ315_003087 [Exocentrus adspersus]